MVSALLLLLCGAALAAPPEPDPDPPATEYLRAVHERIHWRWRSFLAELPRVDRRYQDPSLSTELVLSVSADGTVARFEQPSRSGLWGFDQAAVDVVRDLGRLSPPPASLRSDDGQVYLRWRFSRQRPGCEQRSVIHRLRPVQEAIPLLVAQGRTDEAITRLRQEAQSDPNALRLLAEWTGRIGAQAPDSGQRAAAAGVLAHFDAGEAALLRLVTDPDRAVRRAALQALGQRALSPAAVPVLRQALSGDNLALAAALLSRLGDRSGIPLLRAALGQGLAPVENAAMLRALGDELEAQRIIRGLLAGSATARAGAQAARGLADPALTEALLGLYRPASPDLRAEIVSALGAMGRRAPQQAHLEVYRALLDQAPVVRLSAVGALAAFREHNLGIRYRVIDALVDPVPDIRAAAAAALVEVGGEAARDELIRAGRDRNIGVRVALCRSLDSHPIHSLATLQLRLRGVPAVAQACLATRPPRGSGAELLAATEPLRRMQAAAGWLALHRQSQPLVDNND